VKVLHISSTSFKLPRSAFQSADKIILENVSNSKEYWKLMKMLIKSNKPSYNLPPLKNIVDDIEADKLCFSAVCTSIC
jgi:hypothetical protein